MHPAVLLILTNALSSFHIFISNSNYPLTPINLSPPLIYFPKTLHFLTFIPLTIPDHKRLLPEIHSTQLLLQTKPSPNAKSLTNTKPHTTLPFPPIYYSLLTPQPSPLSLLLFGRLSAPLPLTPN